MWVAPGSSAGVGALRTRSACGSAACAGQGTAVLAPTPSGPTGTGRRRCGEWDLEGSKDKGGFVIDPLLFL